MAETRRRVRPRVVREPPGPEGALELAARYLATRPRSAWEVERRLARAGTAPDIAEATIDRLRDLGFVDDAAFARWWLEQRDRHAPRGRRMLEAELRQHGVGRETIEALREELDEQELLAAVDRPSPDGPPAPLTERERAEAALAAHLRGRAVPGEPRALQQLGMYLVRRGFDPETARTVVRAAARDAEELPE